MATISVIQDGASYRITLEGQLTASDLGRLEHACGAALEHKRAPLELNVEGVVSMDDPARGYLDRLRARGARIRGDLDAPGVRA
jgi:hypothetical protein